MNRRGLRARLAAAFATRAAGDGSAALAHARAAAGTFALHGYAPDEARALRFLES